MLVLAAKDMKDVKKCPGSPNETLVKRFFLSIRIKCSDSNGAPSVVDGVTGPGY